MKKNMGTVDRAMRIIVALIIGILLIFGQISGTLAVVLGIFLIMLLLTSAIGWCPLYIPLGISTRKPGGK